MIDLRINDLKRTYGIFQALNGVSLPIIGRGLGHKSYKSTQVYASLLLDPIRNSATIATSAIINLE